MSDAKFLIGRIRRSVEPKGMPLLTVELADIIIALESCEKLTKDRDQLQLEVLALEENNKALRRMLDALLS